MICQLYVYEYRGLAFKRSCDHDGHIVNTIELRFVRIHCIHRKTFKLIRAVKVYLLMWFITRHSDVKI